MSSISAIIPTYNRPHQLVACLLALEGAFPPEGLEVIVVDDGGSVPVRSAIDALELTFDVTVVEMGDQSFKAIATDGDVR